jgi:hypothetical protein
VRELRDLGGRMPYRLWYGEVEIDMIMENDLRRSGTARIGEAAVEVDAFIEIYLGSTPEYVGLPPGVQGATDFARDGSVRMRISASRSPGTGPGQPHSLPGPAVASSRAGVANRTLRTISLS